MKPLALFLALLAPAFAAKPNVLLICVDDLRPELKSFGAGHIHSPAMDSLAATGRAFTRHYVQAPTCGASRYTLLTGKYGKTPAQKGNDALMASAKDADKQPFSLPRQFRENGYRTVAVGKVSHYPGGLGGKDWNDPAKTEMPGSWDVNIMPTGPWKTPQAAMHGYADGVPRGSGTPVSEHKEGDDMRYTDGWVSKEALKQMDGLAEKKEPFFLAVGIMKPHLPFACPKPYLDLYAKAEFPPIPHPQKPAGLSTWHNSGEFNRYARGPRDPWKEPAYADDIRRSYAACVSFADAQVAQLLAHLEKRGLAENTIVVLWGDHGWHLGEHAIWGKHTLFEESLRAPLVIRAPGMKHAGQATEAIVETIDLYPTLCELAGVPVLAGLSGSSLLPHLDDPKTSGGEAVSYFGANETIRTDRHRLIRHNNGKKQPAYELYDHSSPEKETKNIANAHPDLVRDLAAKLDAKLGK
jgi:iduronate 2-sulfatase